MPDTVNGASDEPRRKPRMRPGRRAALSQVLDLQQAAYSTAMLLRDDASKEGLDPERRAKTATALGNLIKAWESAEDRKRIIRGKPLPGSLRPAAAPKQKKGAMLTFVPSEESQG